jgi:hypothetical protein
MHIRHEAGARERNRLLRLAVGFSVAAYASASAALLWRSHRWT